MREEDFSFIFKDIKNNKARPVNQDCWVFQCFLTFWGKVETINSMYPFNYYAIGTTQEEEDNYIEDEVREKLVQCIGDDLLYDVATINVEQYCDPDEFEIESIYEKYKKGVDRGNENMRKLAIYEDEGVFLIPIESVESINVRRMPA